MFVYSGMPFCSRKNLGINLGQTKKEDAGENLQVKPTN